MVQDNKHAEYMENSKLNLKETAKQELSMLFWKWKLEVEIGWTNAKNNNKKNKLRNYKTKQ